MGLSERLARLKDQIVTAAHRSGRRPDEITLIGVSKTVDRAVITRAYELGVTDFGENRVPDIEAKFVPLPYPLASPAYRGDGVQKVLSKLQRPVG